MFSPLPIPFITLTLCPSLTYTSAPPSPLLLSLPSLSSTWCHLLLPNFPSHSIVLVDLYCSASLSPLFPSPPPPSSSASFLSRLLPPFPNSLIASSTLASSSSLTFSLFHLPRSLLILLHQSTGSTSSLTSRPHFLSYIYVSIFLFSPPAYQHSLTLSLLPSSLTGSTSSLPSPLHFFSYLFPSSSALYPPPIVFLTFLLLRILTSSSSTTLIPFFHSSFNTTRFPLPYISHLPTSFPLA